MAIILQQGHSSLHIRANKKPLPLSKETSSVANTANKQPKQPERAHSVDLHGAWKKAVSHPGVRTRGAIMTKSDSCINIQTDLMTVNSLMAKQTQSHGNWWRWRCLLWYVLHYELWVMNHTDSILLQFSLGLVTTKFIDTKSVSREPGGYKCKTATYETFIIYVHLM